MSDNIISFHLKQKEYQKANCPHNSILVDREKWLIECEDCQALIDPIWWISELAKKEGLAEYKLNKLNEKLRSRSRTKCTHCGKMTKIT